jgi:enolase-phosphatase E1
VTISLRERGVRGVVLDIEGTTTPLSFVYDVLFPYAREHVRSYVEFHIGRPELDEPVRLLKQEWEDDVARGLNPPPEMRDVERDASLHCVVNYVLWLMRQDRKSPGLKLLQGLVWERGYADGSLKGDVYPDVPPALERWRHAGIVVAIYSSGSVLAQRLLFSTTAHGDLTRFIDQYFDTGVGPKREPESYRGIAQSLGDAPGSLVFVSDVAAERDAAAASGWQVVLCVRPGYAGHIPAGREVVTDFGQLIM